jgi:hypothetical protein
VTSRWRRLGRIVAVLGALHVVGGGAVAIVLLRDPTPRFYARHGPIAGVTQSVVEQVGGHDVQTVHLQSASGLAVDFTVKSPPRTPGMRRPLAIILGGHRTGRDAVKLIDDTHGLIVAALSYPFTGNDRVKGLAVLREVPALRRGILDTPPAIMLALDQLLARPDVDPSRVELIGVSLGAPFAVIAGALDRRVTRVWSVHGAGDLRTLLDFSLRRSIGFAPLRAVVADLAYVAASGPRIAPERWVGRIAPRPFVMINAEGDERLPRGAILSLYEAAGEPKQLVWMPGQHVQGNRPEIVRRLVAMVLERMAAAP